MSKEDKMEIQEKMCEVRDLENGEELNADAKMEHLNDMGEVEEEDEEEEKEEDVEDLLLSTLLLALDLVHKIEVQLMMAVYTIILLLNACNEMPARRCASRKRALQYAVDWDSQEARAEVEADRALWITLRSSNHRVWAHKSSSDWWEQIMLTTWNKQQWLETIQMTRETFNHIISMLGLQIVRQDTVMCWAFTPENRVAMTIMKLATPSSLHYIANQFCMGPCTARLATHEVYQLLQDIVANNFICLGSPQEVIDGFSAMRFSNCVGALDSTHILMQSPLGTREGSFTNRKGFASMILQAMDHWGWFMNIYMEWAGSTHDTHMFRSSLLPSLMKKGHFAPGVPRTVITVPPLIIADTAYLFKPWLMKPYEEHITNHRRWLSATISANAGWLLNVPLVD
ncbi:hypothetical protein Y1Q_0010056 [Alligator mississippiensis]|uniref:DDE Tnp4 domain-containing protein n=1 Tax=Alligator mississippiensis TaxID=8496 RepID=A0A151P3Z5_ALLMI|nr:hypothetical protein Y1Q_0010056 [Alligator mississippiensis]